MRRRRLHAGRGRAHLLYQLSKRLFGATLEESTCDVDGLSVPGRRWAPTTRRQASVEVRPDAARYTPAWEDLELIVEEDRGLRRAVAEPEYMSELADSAGEGTDSRERTVVRRAVFCDASNRQHSRSLLTRDLHERVDALALVLDVEARLPLLDQLHLVDECREFVGDVLPRDPPGFTDELPCLLALGGPEVG